MGDALDKVLAAQGDEVLALSAIAKIKSYFRIDPRSGKKIEVKAHNRKTEYNVHRMETMSGRGVRVNKTPFTDYHEADSFKRNSRANEVANLKLRHGDKLDPANNPFHVPGTYYLVAEGTDEKGEKWTKAHPRAPHPDDYGGNNALDRWYGMQSQDKYDDYGRRAAQRLNDSDLQDAITEREFRNRMGDHGMSGALDLKTLTAEQNRRLRALDSD